MNPRRLNLKRFSAGILFLLIAVFLCLLAIADSHSLRLMGNSLLLSVATASLAIPIGYLLAIMLSRFGVAGSVWARLSVRLLIFIPLYLQVGCWRSLFGPQGWLQAQLANGANGVLLDGWMGAIVLHAIAAVPWVFLFTELALAEIPAELEEDGLLDGSPWQVLTSVTLQRSLGAVLISFLWILILCYGEMTVTSICNIRTYAEVLFTGITLGELNGEKQLGIWPGVLLMAALILVALWLSTQLLPQLSHADTGRRLHERRLVKSKVVAAISWLLVVCLVGVPLLGLLYKAGVYAERVDDGWVRGWSMMKTVEIVTNSFPLYQDQLIWSGLLGIACACVTTCIAMPLAWATKVNEKIAVGVLAVCSLLFALPGPLIGLGIIQVMNQRESTLMTYLYDQTLLPPLIAVVIVALPICTFLCWYGFRSDSSDLVDSAASEGASFWQNFYISGVLRHKRTLVAVFLVAFSIAIADVGASFLVIPPGIDTVSRRVFGLLHYGSEDNVAGICIVNFLVMGSLALVVQWLFVGRSSDE